MNTTLDIKDPFDRRAIALFGLPFDLSDLNAVAGAVTRAAKRRERLWLSTVNLDWLVLAKKDPAFKRSILASDLVTMDGVPVVKLARLAGAGDAVKVAGSDLFERLRQDDLSVFFFGGRDGAAERAAAVLDAAPSPMRAAGHHNPGFGSVEEMSAEAHLRPIGAAKADLLIASLSSAKGQAWLLRNSDRLDPPVRAHLGAVVDFVAGSIDRAPVPLQRSGLEWAWRIAQEPSLWRRYAGDAAALPALLRSALTVNALLRALAKDAAPAAKTELSQAEGKSVLTLGGPAERDDLKDALRRALHDGRALRVRLRRGAAPDLETFGSLLLARESFSGRGLGYEVCFDDERARHAAELTMGPESTAFSRADTGLQTERASGGRT